MKITTCEETNTKIKLQMNQHGIFFNIFLRKIIHNLELYGWNQRSSSNSFCTLAPLSGVQKGDYHTHLTRPSHE